MYDAGNERLDFGVSQLVRLRRFLGDERTRHRGRHGKGGALPGGRTVQLVRAL
jgi:hypothetical protein